MTEIQTAHRVVVQQACQSRPPYLSKSVFLTTTPSARVLGTPILYATAFCSASSDCVGDVVSAIFANRNAAAGERQPRTVIVVGRNTPGALSSGISISNVPSSLIIDVEYHAHPRMSHYRAYLVETAAAVAASGCKKANAPLIPAFPNLAHSNGEVRG
jgi:hypothetical protein